MEKAASFDSLLSRADLGYFYFGKGWIVRDTRLLLQVENPTFLKILPNGLVRVLDRGRSVPGSQPH